MIDRKGESEYETLSSEMIVILLTGLTPPCPMFWISNAIVVVFFVLDVSGGYSFS